jgi:hypothetical protein
MRFVVPVLAAAILSTAPAHAAPTEDARYRAAVRLENEGDPLGALAAFEALPNKDINTRLRTQGRSRI